MHKFYKHLIAGVSAFVMCLSAVPLSASADTTDIDALQEEFNEVQSSNPDYVEFTCYDLEDGTTSTLLVDDNVEGLEEYIDAQEQFDQFVSTCSIISGSSLVKLSQAQVNNKVGWVTVNNGAMSGTGFLIAPDLVLTAAHCVYGEVNVGFRAGRYNGSNVATSEAEEVFIRSDYNDNGTTPEKDFAVIKLKTAIGNNSNIGYEDIGIPANPVGASVTLQGYPQVNNNPNLEYQFVSSGEVTSVNSGMIYYSASSSGGMSGSPVYVDDGTVIGVHNGAQNSTCNRAVKITGIIYRFTMVDFDTAITMS